MGIFVKSVEIDTPLDVETVKNRTIQWGQSTRSMKPFKVEEEKDCIILKTSFTKRKASEVEAFIQWGFKNSFDPHWFTWKITSTNNGSKIKLKVRKLGGILMWGKTNNIAKSWMIEGLRMPPSVFKKLR